MTKLGSKSIGSIVKLNVNGTATSFIIVHQGLPSSMYDSSCNGTWLLMKDIYEKRTLGSSTNNNDYKNSQIHPYLNDTFLNLFDANIKSAIKQAKIPYVNGVGNSGRVASGANGLPVKIFLLGGYEVGWTTSTNQYFPVDGACLSYFKGTAARDSKRIANYDGSTSSWWLRSPETGEKTFYIWSVNNYGDFNKNSYFSVVGIRPALILDSSLVLNTLPTITSDKSGNLGTLTEGFTFNYTVNDEDGDSVTVKEYLDDVLKRTYTATLGAENTFDCVTAENWQTVLNGKHTLKIVANDGKDDSEPYTVTFTKRVTSATITLSAPLPADDVITAAILTYIGELPEDTNLQILMTNNANDPEPVWEDATADVKNGYNYVFTNQTAVNGFAFNFRINVERGASDIGGYISNIGGAFE